MTEAVCDTGSALHLHEIGQLSAFRTLSQISVPGLVAGEMERYGVDLSTLQTFVTFRTVTVDDKSRVEALKAATDPPIHPADAEVLALVRDPGHPSLALTDDMALRGHVEQSGGVAVGSLGLLVRAYTKGALGRSEFHGAVDALLERSTLRLSRAFRVYVRELVSRLDDAG